MTYYDILGVPPSASSEEIKRAYREQIKFFHPDIFRENPEIAEIQTQRLNEAYEVLKDPQKRKNYDLTHDLHDPEPPNQGPPPKQPPSPEPDAPIPPSSNPNQRPRSKFPFHVAFATLCIVLVFIVCLLGHQLYSAKEQISALETQLDTVTAEADEAVGGWVNALTELYDTQAALKNLQAKYGWLDDWLFVADGSPYCHTAECKVLAESSTSRLTLIPPDSTNLPYPKCPTCLPDFYTIGKKFREKTNPSKNPSPMFVSR